MASGWVRISRSLLPRRSRGQSAKRSPRKSLFGEFALLDHRAHGAVEHEDFFARRFGQACSAVLPSKRFWSKSCCPDRPFSRRRERRDCFPLAEGTPSDFAPVHRRRPHAEQMAHRIDQIGAVHGVEMELLDAAVEQVEHLFRRHRRRDQAAGLRIVVQPVETLAPASPARSRRRFWRNWRSA